MMYLFFTKERVGYIKSFNHLEFQEVAMYNIKLKIKNYNDLLSFAKKLNQIEEYKILTDESKLNIIMAYPIIIQTF